MNDETIVNAASSPTLLVAIDGPAGSGKSSVSRAAAHALGFGILDTGAAYRSVAWAALETETDLDDEDAVYELLENLFFSAKMIGEPQFLVQLPGEDQLCDVTEVIRDPSISGQVSRVSAHAAVRELLNGMFRAMVAGSGLPGVVIEGRDITTVVAPDAPVRLLLTASPEIRAARRAGELPGASADAVLADLRARDAKDALVVDFVNPAPGVTLVDTSDMNFAQSVQAVTDAVARAQAAVAGGESR